MTGWHRWLRFNGVGALGIIVQVCTIDWLVDAASLDYRLATVLGVGAAVAHNFCWHWQWTWRDRRNRSCLTTTLLRFAWTNGAISTAGNLVMMRLLVQTLGLPTAAASLGAISACAMVNYWIGDRWVFRGC